MMSTSYIITALSPLASLKQAFLTALSLTGVLALQAVVPTSAQAQHIGFGLSFGSGVELISEGSGNSGDGFLNFNRVLSPPVLLGGSDALTIDLSSNNSGVVILRINAPEQADVTVTVTAPAGNRLDIIDHSGDGPAPSLPFQIGWAYWNLADEAHTGPISATDFGMAREVVSATGSSIPFMSATFPMRRRSATGSPQPPTPPNPMYTGRDDGPQTTAYILVYGTLGPIPEEAQVGFYEGMIDVHVELSTYGEVNN